MFNTLDTTFPRLRQAIRMINYIGVQRYYLLSFRHTAVVVTYP